MVMMNVRKEKKEKNEIDAKHILICTKSSGACNLY